MYMETSFTQQEILINTNATFLAKDWCLKTDNEQASTKTEKEKLEEACWNGALRQLLPELFRTTVDAKDLPIWKIRELNEVFELELSDYPAAVDKYDSITPHLFLSVQEYN